MCKSLFYITLPDVIFVQGVCITGPQKALIASKQLKTCRPSEGINCAISITLWIH